MSKDKKKKLNIKVKPIENENDEMSKDFGPYLKYFREINNLSLAELSKRTGMSASYINRLENGLRNSPSLPILDKLAKALGVSLSELIAIAGYENIYDTPKENQFNDIENLLLKNDISFDINEDKKELSYESKIALIDVLKVINDTSKWEENRRKAEYHLLLKIDKYHDSLDC